MFENIGKATHLIRFVLSVCALLRVVLLSFERYFYDLNVSFRTSVGTTKLGSPCRANHLAWDP